MSSTIIKKDNEKTKAMANSAQNNNAAGDTKVSKSNISRAEQTKKKLSSHTRTIFRCRD